MKKICVTTLLLTFFTHADVQQPGAGAVRRRDAETGVGCGVGEHLGGGAEAVGGDPLHRHLLLIGGIQRPGREGPNTGLTAPGWTALTVTASVPPAHLHRSEENM